MDIEDEPHGVFEPILQAIFGFHPLAIDDVLQEAHVPKVDDWGEYLCLVLHAVAFEQTGQPALDTLELDVLLGRNQVVTYKAHSLAAVDRVWSSFQRDERRLQRGAAYLLYQLIDELVAYCTPVIERIDEIVDRFEDQAFSRSGSGLLQQMFRLKGTVVNLRRIITPQREVLHKLARGDSEVMDNRDRIYFRDVHDLLVRMYDLVETLRGLLGAPWRVISLWSITG